MFHSISIFLSKQKGIFGETDSKEAIKIILSTFNGPWGSEQMKSELKVRSRPREWWGQEQACDHFTAVNAQRKAAEQTQVVQSEGKALVHIPHSAFILEGLKPANEPANISICIMLMQVNSNHYRLTVTIHFWSFLSLNGSCFLSGHFFSWNWSQKTCTHILNYCQDFLLTYFLKWRAQMKSADHLAFSLSNLEVKIWEIQQKTFKCVKKC